MIGCLLAVVLAQSPRGQKQIAAVRSFVREARHYVQRRRPDGVFAFSPKGGTWHRKRSQRDYRHRQRTFDELYHGDGDRGAMVFLRDGKVLLVAEAAGSQNFHWEAEYFYRPDGSLAYCEQDFGRVHGRRGERRTVLDSTGKVLSDVNLPLKLPGREAVTYIPDSYEEFRKKLRPSAFGFMNLMPKGSHSVRATRA